MSNNSSKDNGDVSRRAFENELLEAVKELVKWVKVTSHPQVAKILSDEVRTDAQKIVYKSSDGKRTTKELSELSGRDPSDISKDWKQWTKVGITEQVTAQGGSRGRSLFVLEEFGIEAPKLPQSKTTSTDNSKTNQA